VAEYRGNFGGARADLRPLGGAPDENCFTQCREQARRVYYGAVFEIKKEIPDKLEVFFAKPRFADFGVCAGVCGGSSLPGTG
jgi:hypothetical protein